MKDFYQFAIEEPGIVVLLVIGGLVVLGMVLECITNIFKYFLLRKDQQQEKK